MGFEPWTYGIGSGLSTKKHRHPLYLGLRRSTHHRSFFEKTFFVIRLKLEERIWQNFSLQRF